MLDLAQYSTTTLGLAFAACAVVIAVFGSKMAGYADVIADRTGLGEALIGSVLLGAGTSIAGIVTSTSTAASGAADLSVSNALGGIVAQTMFLALADVFYKNVNLEHAGVSAVNLGQATVLIVLVALPVMAWAAPPITLWGVNLLSPVLIAVYLVGLHNAHRIHQEPMWLPKQTKDTQEDESNDDDEGQSLATLFALFGGLVLVVGFSGYIVGETGLALSERLGLSGSLVGSLGTATVTSLPELVTTIAAVRRGAPQLAIGGIVGGNMFDSLFVAASDFAYREGSIYHAISDATVFWMGLVIVMTAVLLLGLLRREREGPGKIGWESVALIGLWGIGAGLQIWRG
ncbi:sodium:calcium antiporter [Erythrobacter sp.]|uniref:sodium:calcium antiporter n=1 Tax=Erythrobacter sp. TaxID=1042 RepID=UPI0025C190E3|nr:sodium:calcium antiporter [Erythrobacter sp.]